MLNRKSKQSAPLISTNLKAFLDMIAFSEIGPKLLTFSDNGYNVIVGGGRFLKYDDHPRQLVNIKCNGRVIRSTAAGRYQILAHIFDSYKKLLKLPDFGKDSQDRIAIQLIKECKAIEDIEAGRFADAVYKCRSRWASLPGAGYDQHENDLRDLHAAYTRSGGKTL
jgi:muramidase (phage lysozyme)